MNYVLLCFRKFNKSLTNLKNSITQILQKLYFDWAGEVPESIVKMPSSGSGREYYRIFNQGKSTLGAYNPVKEENEAYFSFTETFNEIDIAVPAILKISDKRLFYLVQDLGDDSLFARIGSDNGKFSTDLVSFYKKALQSLAKIQVIGGQKINYEHCHPVKSFDDNAIQWDLNYFKYNFLKLAQIDFNEFLLEDDFKTIRDFILKVPADYFMFRDFQSRNILINDNELYFIDFQGGRKGPLAYDVASLLFQAKAQIPAELREELLKYYHTVVNQYEKVDYFELETSFKVFALLRTLQVLGAYGYRGYFEKKPHFMESIPFAINNLNALLVVNKFPLQLPHLENLAKTLNSISYLPVIEPKKLTITITSFSYRKGIPTDTTENGGGFVFDCRSIHNPGRYEAYQNLTGKDVEVIRFFESEDEMENFLDKVYGLVDRSVEVYLKRNFKHLMVSFGCTGGQHRSVYAAESLVKHIAGKFDVDIHIRHREQDGKTK